MNQSTFDGTGTTTAAFVAVLIHTNPSGALGIGTIKNTGANGMNVQETVTDKFGTTHSVVTAVAPGAVYMLDPQTNFADVAFPYYTSYEVDVEDESSGSHTTYEVHYSGFGSVTA